MKIIGIITATLALALASASLAMGAEAGGGIASNASDAVSFARDVAPILNKQCANCHGPKKSKGGYRLHTFEHLMKAGDGKKPPIAPGNPDGSKLYRLLVADDPDDLMPKDGDPLPKRQIELIRRWIEQGAKFDGADRNTALSTLASSVTHEAAPREYKIPMPVTALAFSPDGSQIAVGGHNEVTIWSATDGTLIRRIGGMATQTLALAYNEAGDALAVGGGVSGELGEVRIVAPATGKLIRQVATLEEMVIDVEFNPGSTQLAVASGDQSVRIFDVASGKQVFRLDDHSDWVMAVAFSRDGQHLATASRDKTAKLIDLPGGEVRRTFRSHEKQVYDVGFSRDGEFVYSIGADRKLWTWTLDEQPRADKKTATAPTPAKAAPTPVRTAPAPLAFDAEPLRLKVTDKGVLVCCSDNTVRLVSPETRKILRTFGVGNEWLYSVSYDEKTGRLAAGSYNGEVHVWNIGDGSSVLAFTAAPGFKAAEKALATELVR